MKYNYVCKILLMIFGIIAIITGAMSMFAGASDPTYSLTTPFNQILDMNLRFLSAIWLGVGLGCLFAVKQVGKDNFTIILLSLLILAGGLGRADNFARFGGVPNIPYLFITISEFVGPALIIWTAINAKKQKLASS